MLFSKQVSGIFGADELSSLEMLCTVYNLNFPLTMFYCPTAYMMISVCFVISLGLLPRMENRPIFSG